MQSTWFSLSSDIQITDKHLHCAHNIKNDEEAIETRPALPAAKYQLIAQWLQFLGDQYKTFSWWGHQYLQNVHLEIKILVTLCQVIFYATINIGIWEDVQAPFIPKVQVGAC